MSQELKNYNLPYINNTLANEDKIDYVMSLLEDAYNQTASSNVQNRSMVRLAKQGHVALDTFKTVVHALKKMQDQNQ